MATRSSYKSKLSYLMDQLMRMALWSKVETRGALGSDLFWYHGQSDITFSLMKAFYSFESFHHAVKICFLNVTGLMFIYFNLLIRWCVSLYQWSDSAGIFSSRCRQRFSRHTSRRRSRTWNLSWIPSTLWSWRSRHSNCNHCSCVASRIKQRVYRELCVGNVLRPNKFSFWMHPGYLIEN